MVLYVQIIMPSDDYTLNAGDILNITWMPLCSPDIVEHPSMPVNRTREMSIPSFPQKDSTVEKIELASHLGSLIKSRNTLGISPWDKTIRVASDSSERCALSVISSSNSVIAESSQTRLIVFSLM